MENFGKDWICSQNLVSSLGPMKYYKSQKQYFPMENLLQLESEASLLDMSSRGRYSVPMRNLECWEKRARKLVAINLHADLFSSAAYLLSPTRIHVSQRLVQTLVSCGQINKTCYCHVNYFGHRIVSG